MKESKRTHIALAFLLAVSLALCVTAIGSQLWISYKSDIITQQKEQLLIMVQALSTDLSHTITYRVEDLEQLSDIIEQTDPNQEPLVDPTYTIALLNKTYIHSAVLRSAQGTRLWGIDDATPQTILGTVAYDSTINLVIFNDQQGDICYMLEKTLSDGRVLQLILDLETYYHDVTADIQVGETGYVSVKSTQGIIFLDSQTNHLGLHTIQGLQALYEDMYLDLDSAQLAFDYQCTHLWGVYEYKSYWWDDDSLPYGRKIAAHAQADFGESTLLVSTVVDYDSIYGPLEQSLQSIVQTCVSLGVILILFFLYIISLNVQRKKIRQEITYLEQLNQVLAETQRTQEAISHQQRLQIMGTMTGGIAHEFNNMLTPIMAYAELLQYRFNPESEEYEFTEEIIDAAQHAKEVIGNISQLSRRNMDTVFRFCPANKLLKRSVKMIGSLCPEAVTLTQHFDLPDSCGVLCNETQINQVLLNLCVNAFHAVEGRRRPQVAITCQINDTDATQPLLTIAVTDNGCGMEPTVKSQVFYPFFTTKVGGQGTGLGLSIVDQIIHTHKGRIQVDSVLGKGSTFTVFLPLVDKEAVEQVQNQETTEQLSILAVDSNSKILRLLEKTLDKPPFTLHTCTNLDDATMFLAQNPCQVLLIDEALTYGSPLTDAIAYCMAMGQKYPHLTKLVFTSQVRKEVLEAKQHGLIEGYLEKPVSDVMILDAIRKMQG